MSRNRKYIDPNPERRPRLNSALSNFLWLSSKYHETVWANFYRADIVRRFPVGGKRGVDVFTVRCGGSGMMNIAPCDWADTIERPGDGDSMWLTPNNACPGCGNSISVKNVEYGRGSIPPERWESRPIPETQAEYDRVGREQHELHMALYAARKSLEAIACD